MKNYAKDFIIGLLVIISVFTLTFAFCYGMGIPADNETKETIEINRIKVIADHSYVKPYIYVDTVTGVHYLSDGEGGICVMVDADGKPLVDKGE